MLANAYQEFGGRRTVRTDGLTASRHGGKVNLAFTGSAHRSCELDSRSTMRAVKLATSQGSGNMCFSPTNGAEEYHDL